MRSLLLLIASFAIFTASTSAQSTRVVVATGGKFEFAPPFSDYVQLGFFDPTTNTYTPFDQVGTQSVQHLAAVGTQAFVVAAQDSLVLYNTNGTRQAATAFPEAFASPLRLASDGHIILNGKWYGNPNQPFLYIHQAQNLTLLQSVPDIKYPVRGMCIHNNKAYIAQNTPATTDLCPPYGCYTDSLGFVAEIDLNDFSLSRTFWLGNQASGTSDLYVYNDTLYTVNRVRQSISRVSLADGTVQHSQIDSPNPITQGIALHQGILYLLSDNTIYQFSTTTQHILPSVVSPTISPLVTGSYNASADQFYVTSTDFGSYGNIQTISGSTSANLAVEVGIAPEALLVLPNTSATNSPYTQTPTIRLTPNPSTQFLTIQIPDAPTMQAGTLSIIDMQGRIYTRLTYQQLQMQYTLSVQYLPAGTYLVVLHTPQGTYHQQFTKIEHQ